MSTTNVQWAILDITHQDGPFDLLAPSFNLSSCRTNSTAMYGELKSLVVCLALDTIHETMFMVLVPGYSIKTHNVLDHIWQCYINRSGKTVQLSAQVHYSTFLNVIRLFYNLEEYPIDLAGIFQDHIDPSLQKGFCAHYPLYGQTCTKAAFTQWSILVNMLNALIKAENNLNNIRNIVWVEQRGGEQFHLSQGHAHASVAEKSLQHYGNDATQVSFESKGTASKPKCFGCGGPHPWSKLTDSKYTVICPNANEPGVWEKAELNIQKYQLGRRRIQGTTRNAVILIW
jgi:hypothetical protein